MTDIYNRYNRKNIADRQVDELIGLAQGIVADGAVSQGEAEFLQKWLVKNAAVQSSPLIDDLYGKIETVLADGILDADEAADLLDTLTSFAGGDFELGELQKATSLPFDHPLPSLEFADRKFCFTGTFLYGVRTDCEAVVSGLGGQAGSLTRKTDYLVVGAYATDSWAHSSYGRKIEKAVGLRASGKSLIAIVPETHWAACL